MAVSIRRMIKSFLEGFDAAGRLLLFFVKHERAPPMRLPPRGRTQIVQIWQAVPELNNPRALLTRRSTEGRDCVHTVRGVP